MVEANIRFQAALDAAVAAGAPGAVVSVQAPSLGVMFCGASGRFAADSDRALDAADPFRAASVSKAVTSAAAVRLASEGVWSLDSPVAPFLPPPVADLLGRLRGLRSPDELTIRRLLDHTSGVPDYFFDERFQARVRAEPNRTWRPPELAEAALDDAEIVFQPGAGFAYGDSGYVLVGLAIERVLDLPLGDACRSRIFAPLGMDSTYLEWHEPPRGRAVSHHYDGDVDLLPMNTSYDWAGGGLVTTVGDLVKFLHGLFGGALFDAEWLAEMTRWRDELHWKPDSSARYLRYGLGLGVNRAAGQEIVGATGVWGAFAYHWPAGGAAIAGTVNLRRGPRGPLLDSILSVLFEVSGSATS